MFGCPSSRAQILYWTLHGTEPSVLLLVPLVPFVLEQVKSSVVFNCKNIKRKIIGGNLKCF